MRWQQLPTQEKKGCAVGCSLLLLVEMAVGTQAGCNSVDRGPVTADAGALEAKKSTAGVQGFWRINDGPNFYKWNEDYTAFLFGPSDSRWNVSYRSVGVAFLRGLTTRLDE